MAKISVIVPVYKVEQYLGCCVDSILRQTFRDFELILVDDGSPDRCGEICEEFAEKDERVRVLHRENGGLSAARNTGIEWALKNSASKWITFIDSDDWIDEDYLKTLMGAADKNSAAVAVGGVRAVDNEGKILFEQIETTSDLLAPEDLFVRHASLGTWAWGKLYLKSDFVEIRYPEGMVYEDRHTTHKILFKYDKVAVVNKPIYFYRCQRPGNIIGENHTLRNVLHRASGLCCQIDYFHERGFERAERKAAMDLMHWLQMAAFTMTDAKDRAQVRAELARCKKKYWHHAWRDCRCRYEYRFAMFPCGKWLFRIIYACGLLAQGRLGELYWKFKK